jgi:hypothetical protein
MMIDELENVNEAIKRLIMSIYEERVHFTQTDVIQPKHGQAVWVRHRNGAEYRMTYPFNHKDYPLWYPLPKD